MTHPMDGLIRNHYTTDDVRAITRHLVEQGTFQFPTLRSGLCSAALAQSQDVQYTGYQHVWVRDNIHIAITFTCWASTTARPAPWPRSRSSSTHSTTNCGAPSPAQRTLGTDAPAAHPLRWRPARRSPEHWAHAQNGAIGCGLAGRQTGDRGHWQPAGEDVALLSDFVQYLEAIQFWQDEDGGHWEEARKVEASASAGDGG
jgi:phosphorylase kinase alpha/beta subunit